MSIDISDLIVGQSKLHDDGLQITAEHRDEDYVQMFRRLKIDISNIDVQIRSLFSTDSSESRFFIYPFLCRKMLEICTTGLLARIDPLRVVSVRKYQVKGFHKVGKPNKVSIAWLGDIIQKDVRSNGDIWDEDQLKSGPERSLFGCHVGSVAIEPGMRWVTDAYSLNQAAKVDARLLSSRWLYSLALVEKPLEQVRSNILRLYSHFSKGVHSEYLIDSDAIFNYDSMIQDVVDTYKYICIYAVATHVTSIFNRSYDPRLALSALLDAEEFFLKYENDFGGRNG